MAWSTASLDLRREIGGYNFRMRASRRFLRAAVLAMLAVFPVSLLQVAEGRSLESMSVGSSRRRLAGNGRERQGPLSWRHEKSREPSTGAPPPSNEPLQLSRTTPRQPPPRLRLPEDLRLGVLLRDTVHRKKLLRTLVREKMKRKADALEHRSRHGSHRPLPPSPLAAPPLPPSPAAEKSLSPDFTGGVLESVAEELGSISASVERHPRQESSRGISVLAMLFLTWQHAVEGRLVLPPSTKN